MTKLFRLSKGYLVATFCFFVLLILPISFARGAGNTIVRRDTIGGGIDNWHYGDYTVGYINDDYIHLTLVSDDGWQNNLAPNNVVEHTYTKSAHVHLNEYPTVTQYIAVFDPLTKDEAASTYNQTALKWGAFTASRAGYTFASYTVQRATVTTYQSNWTDLATTTSTSYTDTSVQPSTTYLYQVVLNFNPTYGAGGTNTLTVQTPAAPISTPESAPADSSTAITPTTTTKKTTSKVTTKNTTPTPSSTTPAVTTPAVTPTVTVSAETPDVTKIRLNNQAIGSNTANITTPTMTLSGTTKPNTVVTITVHSQPITKKITADAQGSWSTPLDLSSLDRGSHTVSAVYTLDGSSSPDIKLFSFNYNPSRKTLIYTAVGILLILLLSILLFVLIRRRLHRNDPKTPFTPPPTPPMPPVMPTTTPTGNTSI